MVGGGRMGIDLDGLNAIPQMIGHEGVQGGCTPMQTHIPVARTSIQAIIFFDDNAGDSGLESGTLVEVARQINKQKLL